MFNHGEVMIIAAGEITVRDAIVEVLAEKEGRKPAMYIFRRLIAITEEGRL